MSRITEALERAKGIRPPAVRSSEPIPWDLSEDRSLPPAAPVRPFDYRLEPQVEPVSGAVAPVLPATGDYAEKLIGSGLDHVIAEQYRRVCATLHQLQCDTGIRVLMVTSALPAEGKTLVASNVALVLSTSFGRRVLLIDGDLRRPKLHEVFGVPDAPSNGDGAGSASGGLKIVKLSSTLSLIPGGAPQADPMRVLVNGPIRQMLTDGVSKYDWIILDTPPIGLLPDAHLLAAAVDRALVVVRAGSTPYDAIQRTVQLIGEERLVGVVLNRADSDRTRPFSESYPDYYEKRE